MLPVRCWDISWTNSGLVTIGSFGINFSEMSITIHSFSYYSDVIIGAIASQITRLTNVYSTVYSGADQRKHQSSASLAFKRGIHRRPVNSPHKWPVTREMFLFDDVIMLKNALDVLSTNGNEAVPGAYSRRRNIDYEIGAISSTEIRLTTIGYRE